MNSEQLENAKFIVVIVADIRTKTIKVDKWIWDQCIHGMTELGEFNYIFKEKKC